MQSIIQNRGGKIPKIELNYNKKTDKVTLKSCIKAAYSKPITDTLDKKIRDFLASLFTKIGGDSSAGHHCGKQLYDVMMTKSDWKEWETRNILLQMNQDVTDLINKVKNPQQSEFIVSEVGPIVKTVILSN